MKQNNPERDVGSPVVYVEDGQPAARPLPDSVIARRQNETKQDIDCEEHHRGQARKAGEIDCRHLFGGTTRR